MKILHVLLCCSCTWFEIDVTVKPECKINACMKIMLCDLLSIFSLIFSLEDLTWVNVESNHCAGVITKAAISLSY